MQEAAKLRRTRALMDSNMDTKQQTRGGKRKSEIPVQDVDGEAMESAAKKPKGAARGKSSIKAKGAQVRRTLLVPRPGLAQKNPLGIEKSVEKARKEVLALIKELPLTVTGIPAPISVTAAAGPATANVKAKEAETAVRTATGTASTSASASSSADVKRSTSSSASPSSSAGPTIPSALASASASGSTATSAFAVPARVPVYKLYGCSIRTAGTVLEVRHASFKPRKKYIDEIRRFPDLWDRFLGALQQSHPFYAGFKSNSELEAWLTTGNYEPELQIHELSEAAKALVIKPFDATEKSAFVELNGTLLSEWANAFTPIKDMKAAIQAENNGKRSLFFLPNFWSLKHVEEISEIPTDFAGSQILVGQDVLVPYRKETVGRHYRVHSKMVVIDPTDYSRPLSLENLVLPKQMQPPAETETWLQGLSASWLKSLLQKLIRYQAHRVMTPHAKSQVTVPVSSLIPAVIVALMHARGVLNNRHHRVISGAEGAFKRLPIIVVEDSFIEDGKDIVNSLASACIAKSDHRWRPSISMAERACNMAVEALVESRTFDHEAIANKKKKERKSSSSSSSSTTENESWTLASALLESIGGMDGDKRMFDRMAHRQTLSSKSLPVKRPDIMEFSHCIDQHCAPAIAYYIDAAIAEQSPPLKNSAPMGPLFQKLFDRVTGINPRRGGVVDESSTFCQSVRLAQKRFMFGLEMARQPPVPTVKATSPKVPSATIERTGSLGTGMEFASKPNSLIKARVSLEIRDSPAFVAKGSQVSPTLSGVTGAARNTCKDGSSFIKLAKAKATDEKNKNEYRIRHVLADDWLAGGIGVVDLAHKPLVCGTVKPSCLHEMVIFRKPKRDNVAELIEPMDEDLKAQHRETFLKRLCAGVPWVGCTPPIPEWRSATIKILSPSSSTSSSNTKATSRPTAFASASASPSASESTILNQDDVESTDLVLQYAIRLSDSKTFVPWEQIKVIEKSYPFLPRPATQSATASSSATASAASAIAGIDDWFPTPGDGILEGAPEAFSAQLSRTSMSALRRVVLHAGQASSKITMPRLARDGSAIKGYANIYDIAAFQFLLFMAREFPVALRFQQTLNGELVFHVRDTVLMNHLMRQVKDHIRNDLGDNDQDPLELGTHPVPNSFIKPGGLGDMKGAWPKAQDTMKALNGQPRVLFGHQVEGVSNLWRRYNLGFRRHSFVRPTGSGKTMLCLTYIAEKIERKSIPPYMLYTAPAEAIESLYKEMMAFGFTVCILDPSKKSLLRGNPALQAAIASESVMKPFTITLVEHDKLRLLTDAITPQQLAHCVFWNDEAHKTLNQTARTDAANSFFAGAHEAAIMSATLVNEASLKKIIPWLESEFPLTVDNCLVIMCDMDARCLPPFVSEIRTVVSELLLPEERKQYNLCMPAGLGGANALANQDTVRQGKLLTIQVMNRGVVKQVLSKLDQKSCAGVHVVADSKNEAEHLKQMLVQMSDGKLQASEIAVIGSVETPTIDLKPMPHKRIDASASGSASASASASASSAAAKGRKKKAQAQEETNAAHREVRVVISPKKACSGYNLTRFSVNVKRVFEGKTIINEIQMDGRINRPGQPAAAVEYITVLDGAGLWSRTLQNQKYTKDINAMLNDAIATQIPLTTRMSLLDTDEQGQVNPTENELVEELVQLFGPRQRGRKSEQQKQSELAEKKKRESLLQQLNAQNPQWKLVHHDLAKLLTLRESQGIHPKSHTTSGMRDEVKSNEALLQQQMQQQQMEQMAQQLTAQTIYTKGIYDLLSGMAWAAARQNLVPPACLSRSVSASAAAAAAAPKSCDAKKQQSASEKLRCKQIQSASQSSPRHNKAPRRPAIRRLGALMRLKYDKQKRRRQFKHYL